MFSPSVSLFVFEGKDTRLALNAPPSFLCVGLDKLSPAYLESQLRETAGKGGRR